MPDGPLRQTSRRSWRAGEPAESGACGVCSRSSTSWAVWRMAISRSAVRLVSVKKFSMARCALSCA